MKEQVAEILGNMAHEVKQCGSKDPALGLAIKQATLEICQLFEPKSKRICVSIPEVEPPKWFKGPKPDEGRVDEEILDFIKARLEMTYAYGLSALSWDREEVAKQILAKTASIKDAECQERIFKEIEKHYTATFHGYDNIFLTQGEWEALKKELK